MRRIIPLVIFIWILVACSSARVSTPTLVSEPPATSNAIPTSTREPTQTSVPPTQTQPSPTETVTLLPPTETPIPACVVLKYGEYAQFEILSPTGQRVLIDINDPEKLSSPASAAHILLTTHTHWDHYNPDFQAAFPGEQLFVQTGSLELQDGNIQGIASAHNASDRLKPEGGTNYIYLIELGGLRIAHFGDIGQNELTEDQIAVLGNIDIAITQINNPYSDMNAENRKGINLMEQLQPKLVIPTHVNLDTTKLAVAQWAGFYIASTTLQICESDLSRDGIQFLLMGEAAETMIKYVDLAEWGQ